MDTKIKSTNNRIKIIDLFKGLAAIGVIVQHIFLPQNIQNLLLLPFSLNLAVPVFVIISGFTFALSTRKYQNNNKSLLKNYFSASSIMKKVKRIYLPFVIIYLFEIICVMLKGERFSLPYLCKQFVLGGFIAPGNYYIPILLQLIIVFPFVYLMYSKWKKYSFAAVAVLQLAYEFIINYFDIPQNITRYSAVRYLFFLLCGIWLFNNYKRKPDKTLCIFSALLGMGWIIAISYFDFEPQYLFATWSTTALPVAFWLMPIIWICFYKFTNCQSNCLSFIYKIGEASYHIYLIQMVYFLFVGNKFENDILNTVLALAVCLTLGYLFYFAESKINSYLHKKTR